jgi:two-component system response regulator AlgR
MRVLVVDDETPARERLRLMLAEIPGTTCVGEAGSGPEALELVARERPDALLLDIRLPGMSGLEVARHAAAFETPPAIVFTTAYDQHALEAFDAQAVGYLLKPVRIEKLAAALARARQLARRQVEDLVGTVAAARRRTHLAIRAREQLRLVPVHEVLCFVADMKYVTVRHVHGEDLIDESLKALEEEFGDEFLRVHRNALVAVRHIESIERQGEGQCSVRLRHGGGAIQVSRRLVADVLRRFKPQAP